jgi:hypothetical protein
VPLGSSNGSRILLSINVMNTSARVNSSCNYTPMKMYLNDLVHFAVILPCNYIYNHYNVTWDLF